MDVDLSSCFHFSHPSSPKGRPMSSLERFLALGKSKGALGAGGWLSEEAPGSTSASATTIHKIPPSGLKKPPPLSPFAPTFTPNATATASDTAASGSASASADASGSSAAATIARDALPTSFGRSRATSADGGGGAAAVGGKEAYKKRNDPLLPDFMYVVFHSPT